MIVEHSPYPFQHRGTKLISTGLPVPADLTCARRRVQRDPVGGELPKSVANPGIAQSTALIPLVVVPT